MLIDYENIGYVKCDNTLLPTDEKYIPASTWGFIKGDITEQKDLVDLITNIESGLTPEQIEMLSNASDRLNDIEAVIDNVDIDYISNMINGVKVELNRKAYKSDVYTKQEIDNKGYLTEHQSLADYYTKSEITDIIDNINPNGVDLSSYATKKWVENKNYLTEHQSLADYYTKSEMNDVLSNIEVDLTGYATESWVNEQGYISESTLLTDYYTKQEIDDAFNNIEVGLTPEQIEIINNLDVKFEDIELDITELTTDLLDKADKDSVYTKQEIDSKGYLTEHQSLDGYATESWVNKQGYIDIYNNKLINYYTKSEVDNIVSDNKVDLTGYATESWVSNQSYLTQLSLVDYVTYHTERLSNYYLKSETDEMLANKLDINLIWTGTQSDWDALSADEQAQYIIAMIEQ